MVIWIAVLVAVAAVGVAGWLGLRKGPPPVVPSASAADAPTAEQPPDKADQTRSSTRPRDIRRSPVNAATGIDTKGAEKSAAVAPEPSASSATEAAHAVTVGETGQALAQPLSNSNPTVVVATLPEDNFVYSSGSGVTPPRLMSLGFPQPLVRGFDTRTSTLELVVSKSGTVERAKISSVSRNWEDAMLLSRAKTFQFVPAQRNGDPVRYRLLMNVETNP